MQGKQGLILEIRDEEEGKRVVISYSDDLKFSSALKLTKELTNMLQKASKQYSKLTHEAIEFKNEGEFFELLNNTSLADMIDFAESQETAI